MDRCIWTTTKSRCNAALFRARSQQHLHGKADPSRLRTAPRLLRRIYLGRAWLYRKLRGGLTGNLKSNVARTNCNS
ncbi:hypothetical protein NQ318_020867 [Aromia moschata]|uniref:Ribosomal protein L20 n=1 Tax=Aromia moschata TaxID=1265417 RepID=A0AAV8XLB7_9CUCU|nr:hypothetical protein NQ318_020867 [Aromia moschata]